MKLPRLLFGSSHPTYHALVLCIALYVAYKVRKLD